MFLSLVAKVINSHIRSALTTLNVVDKDFYVSTRDFHGSLKRYLVSSDTVITPPWIAITFSRDAIKQSSVQKRKFLPLYKDFQSYVADGYMFKLLSSTLQYKLFSDSLDSLEELEENLLVKLFPLSTVRVDFPVLGNMSVPCNFTDTVTLEKYSADEAGPLASIGFSVEFDYPAMFKVEKDLPLIRFPILTINI